MNAASGHEELKKEVGRLRTREGAGSAACGIRIEASCVYRHQRGTDRGRYSA